MPNVCRQPLYGDRASTLQWKLLPPLVWLLLCVTVLAGCGGGPAPATVASGASASAPSVAPRTPPTRGALSNSATTSSPAVSTDVPAVAGAPPGIGVSPAAPTIEPNAIAPSSAGARVRVVAAENFWGSIALQLGGDRVHVTSVITNPDTDPHDYEPKPTDARLVATAQYVIANGAGYDPWVPKLLGANPVAGRKVLTVGDLVGKKDGDNPHLWYNPAYVTATMNQITADYKALDPADSAYFDRQHQQFDVVGLKTYHTLIATIQQRYSGTPVSATESIFVYQADALGLDLITPPGFMQAISDGGEPTAMEKATFQQQIGSHQIKVFVNNKQNETPDTTSLIQRAQAAGIPIVDITETPDPATASFQDWQDAQLEALQQALAKATGT